MHEQTLKIEFLTHFARGGRVIYIDRNKKINIEKVINQYISWMSSKVLQVKCWFLTISKILQVYPFNTSSLLSFKIFYIFLAPPAS
jgi:hypothetical protein